MKYEQLYIWSTYYANLIYFIQSYICTSMQKHVNNWQNNERKERIISKQIKKEVTKDAALLLGQKTGFSKYR